MSNPGARSLVFDLDGTICFDGRTIDQRIRSAIQRRVDAGYRLVFASARPVRDMLPVLDGDFGTATLIGGNGSLVSVGGDVRARAFIDPTSLGSLLAACGRWGATYLVDGPWDYAYTGSPDHPLRARIDQGLLARQVEVADLPEVVKFLVLTAEDMPALAAAGRELGLVVNHHLEESIIDISPAATTKWEALRAIGHTRYIAFGNDLNDIDLLRNAARAIRVGAHPSLDHVAHLTVLADPEAVAAEIDRLPAVIADPVG
ncbi:Cof-type HAD-IIB family hydrolase [Nocardia sp. JMUB6875]|uniref:HAD hydrolase family protein n=1 Tax=Nocardia sp. JMUB6875 TaxID=3158170 RepID=UPI0032E54516